ncbi:MAG TPA: RNA methyltransferase [Candidatus Angelobacter sp.]|jgi:TrmH family RNA methyltransferase
MSVPKEIETRLRRVSSRQNALVKELRKALSQGEPTAEGYLAVEGIRMIEEAIRSGLRFQAIFFSDAGSAHATRLLPQIGSQVEVLLLPDEVFVSAVSTESPQGAAALVKLRPQKFEDLLEAGPDPLFVAVAGIQDPGNLGTIIRSAEAFGVRAVLLGEKTVSHFNPKTVRGSAGSLFRQPILRVKLGESIMALKQQGVRVLATSSHKGKPLQEANFTAAAMIVVGNEGAGVPADILSVADELVTIPHSPRVESLNAGIAASILLYEAARQRSKNLTTDEHG